MMGFGYGNSLGWLGMGVGMIMHLAFTALLVMAVIWLFKAVFQGEFHTGRRTGAIEILKQRYAGGEITREEYQQMKQELE